MKSKKKVNPKSLENLKKGSIARNLNKKQTAVSLFPKTIEMCDRTGNRSKAIDMAIALLIKHHLLDEWQQLIDEDYF